MSHTLPFAPTRARDQVLRRYLAAWSRSLLQEVRKEVDLSYVVGFAGAGGVRQHRAARGDGDAFERLLATLGVLDALPTSASRRRARSTATVLLVEEDPVLCERLRGRLHAAGLGDRVRETRELQSGAPGEIVLVNAGFAELASELQRDTANPCYALYFLDPPSPAKLPLEAVHPLLQQEGTDLILGFPAPDLHRQAPYRRLPVADLPPHPRRIVEGYSLLFGDRSYEWLALWRAAEREGGEEGTAAAEARMLEHYRVRLGEAAPRAAIRWVPLLPPDTAADPLYLFLVTEDPERALLLNRVLHEARLAGEVAWGDALSGYVREEESGVLDLFAPEEPGSEPGPARLRTVNLPALAHEIATCFVGRVVPFREVLLWLADTDLFVEEIKQAMSLLRREGRVSYDRLEMDAEIGFAEGERS